MTTVKGLYNMNTVNALKERKTVDMNSHWRKRFEIIPYGSSTCAKVPKLFPDEPSVIVRGLGCRIWDANGKEYIDFRNSLGPVILGYQYPAVDDAIRRQLDWGISFGHPNPLECEVAELVCQMVPCAERARILKTGAEAVAACIRIARGYTHREHVVQVGYNGWLNSLSSDGVVLPGKKSQSVPVGVPECLSKLHHGCEWNDIDRMRQLFDMYPGQIAAVVIAANYEFMDMGRDFYSVARELTAKNGAVLIYDEIVTGFRVSRGGIQEYFDVIPDMAAFAKGVSNGMPVAVYCGTKELMDFCEKGKVFITSTLAGETLSLAAAKATLTIIRDCDVVEHIWRQGEKLQTRSNDIFGKYDVPIRIKGLPACAAVVPLPGSPADTMEMFYRATFRNGLSLYNVLYPNYSHYDEDIDETIERLEDAVREL